MKAKVLFSVAIVAAACSAAAISAQKGKGAALPKMNVFSAKVYAIEPNIEAVLMFTDEQKEKLKKAMQETVQAPAVNDLKAKKGDPVDKAKQAKFKEEMTRATGDLKKRVDEILTAEQKATIQKVEEALKTALDNALTKEQKDKLASMKKPKKGK